MTAPITTTIYIAWTLLAGFGRIQRRDAAIYAAPFAGLACAAFGVWYY